MLALLDKDQHRGKIAQILTGESKTLIKNCLAIFFVLRGHKVDIVTSNPVLAKRDAEESERMYNYFGVSVGHNVNDEQEEIRKLIKMEKEGESTLKTLCMELLLITKEIF